MTSGKSSDGKRKIINLMETALDMQTEGHASAWNRQHGQNCPRPSLLRCPKRCGTITIQSINTKMQPNTQTKLNTKSTWLKSDQVMDEALLRTISNMSAGFWLGTMRKRRYQQSTRYFL